ncbi:response regulator [bacterium]|nr:response regulator [bacterium]
MVNVNTKLRKILIVDNDDYIIFFLKKILEQYSYDIMRASTGEEAISIARKYHPDLIILDIMMSGMHGFSVCHIIKNDAKLSQTKILMLSAKSFDADKRKALEAGADAYMTKPFDLNEVAAKVEELLS